ncbi:TRAFAC clade GTPase domain-containing protein [Sphaerimonospora cavernae]|uniref:TRAFAC clade GTPase domain-containing protein n=1 Tax=Sphaerimonospora cavernae TaxID=1740611 RepID=UPI00373FDB70
MIVGIVGLENAGKTTLLGAWYLLLGNGTARFKDRRFAGSFSLDGWEAVARSLRWSPGQLPGFPPHTTSRSGRAPGLLHLSFWDAVGERSRDYLLTDAPGEWFQRWAMNRDTPEAEGARWVAEHADVLLLIADREALAGERRGAGRGALQRLCHRLAAERRARPIALVWTKSDVEIAPEIEDSVRRSVLELMPDAVEFSVSVVEAGSTWTDLLDWALKARRPRVELPPRTVINDDPLFLYGV